MSSDEHSVWFLIYGVRAIFPALLVLTFELPASQEGWSSGESDANEHRIGPFCDCYFRICPHPPAPHLLFLLETFVCGLL
jgi:hypothetical protein